MPIFKGSATAIATPFTEDGKSVDFATLEKFVEFQIASGIKALVVNGTSGEASTMTLDEDSAVLECVLKVTNGRIPIIAGTGSNDTSHAIKESKIAAKLGASAVMLVTPYYNKTSQVGLIKHFEAIADAIDIPIILYNVPGRTGMTIQVDTVLQLMQHPQIVGLKDATGDMSYTMELFAKRSPDFALYCGNDDLLVPFLSMGGEGVISVVSNMFPEEMQAICNYAYSGDFTRAAKATNNIYPIFSAIFADVNPIGIKAGLQIMGMGNGVLRLPLVSMAASQYATLKEAVANYK